MSDSIFEDLVRTTIGPKLYDSVAEENKKLTDRYESGEFHKEELWILNYLHQNGGEVRTGTLESEFVNLHPYPPYDFEYTRDNLYMTHLIDSGRVDEGWDKIHYTSITDAGKQLLGAL